MNFSTFIAVDDKYLAQLRLTMPTWEKYRREIWEHPLFIVYDHQQVRQRDMEWIKHPDIRFVPWPPAIANPYANQRDKMLSSLVWAPARHCTTPWYLKIDCDTWATEQANWIKDKWFVDDPAFVAVPWGYTKPAQQMPMLDEWADGIAGLSEYPRLNLHAEPEAGVLRHKRICSWVFFGNTEWTRRVSKYFPPGNLPAPTQDGTLWFIAARTGANYKTFDAKRLGWRNGKLNQIPKDDE
jgi:hypothetical protein